MTDPYGATATHTKTLTFSAEPNTAPTSAWEASAPVAVTVPHDGKPSTTTTSIELRGVVADGDSDPISSQWVCEGLPMNGVQVMPRYVYQISVIITCMLPGVDHSGGRHLQL